MNQVTAGIRVEPDRRCMREPVPEVEQARSYLEAALASHQAGRSDEVVELIRLANMPAIREWINSIWGKDSPYVQYRPVIGAPPSLAKDQRLETRTPSLAMKAELLSRDGYHCRFCGIPLIRKEVRQRIRELYPAAKVWGRSNIEQHAAFQVMWVQYDHILPHARGGTNELDNLLITCAACNYGRMQYTWRKWGCSIP
jgi:HNH endonuclease